MIVLAFIRGDIVSGETHGRECARTERLIALLESNTDALEAQTDVTEKMSGQVDTLVKIWGGR